MAKRPTQRDPRQLGGSIVGPGGPFDENAVVLDTRNAVLMEHVNVSLVGAVRGGQVAERPTLAMALEGRINKSSDRAEVLYLFDEDGAAAIVSQLVGLAVRIGPEFAARLMARLEGLPTREPDA